jgi:hypothetical protein
MNAVASNQSAEPSGGAKYPDAKRVSWKFGALWTLASALGYCAGGAVMGLQRR